MYSPPSRHLPSGYLLENLEYIHTILITAISGSSQTNTTKNPSSDGGVLEHWKPS